MTGLVATSFANSLSLMYSTYGLVYGLGACFIYNSNYLVVGKYFNEKLSLAVGITALGRVWVSFTQARYFRFFWMRLDGETPLE